MKKFILAITTSLCIATLISSCGKEVIESAGKKSIQYYQITFNVLPDGSIEMKE